MKKRLLYYENIVFLLVLVNTDSIYAIDLNSVIKPADNVKKGELKYYKFFYFSGLRILAFP